MNQYHEPDQKFIAEDGSEVGVDIVDGYALPPFTGVADRMRKLKNFELRDDDIIVAAYPKSGSNWVANLVSMITHKDDFNADRNCDSLTRFFLELHDQSMIEQATSPRILTTHLPPNLLPDSLTRDGKCKLVYVTRNPKDTVVSAFYFFRIEGFYKGSFDGLVEMFMNGKLPYGDWFEYIDTYNKFNAAMKNQVCLLAYEDLKRDPGRHLKRLAAHLGVELTDEEVDLFVDISSVSSMKLRYQNRTDRASQERLKKFRKGIIGDWKTHFTVAMDEMFNTEYERRMKDIDSVYVFE